MCSRGSLRINAILLESHLRRKASNVQFNGARFISQTALKPATMFV